MRRGWKRWADDGFPELTPAVKAKYLFDSRGTDKFERISWDGRFRLHGESAAGHCTRYSGDAGARLLKRKVTRRK